MPLKVEISKIKETTEPFYKQLIDQYPSQTFMLTNDANTSLTYTEDDSTFNEKELNKLKISIFASNGNTDVDNPSVDPKNFHITYDASIFYPVSSVEDNIINSEGQQIKFIDTGIIKKFHNNDTYSAGTIFKALSTHQKTPDNFESIKGVYHAKGVDFRKLNDTTKWENVKKLCELNIQCYTEIIKDFIACNDADTLFLTQIPGSLRSDFSVNFHRVIFYYIYAELKKVCAISRLTLNKSIIFKIDGFEREPSIDELINTDDTDIRKLFEDFDFFSLILFKVKEMIVPQSPRVDPEVPPQKKKRKKSFTTKGKGSKKNDLKGSKEIASTDNGSGSKEISSTNNGSDRKEIASTNNGSNSSEISSANTSKGSKENASTNSSENNSGEESAPTNGKKENVQTNNDAMLLDKFYMELEKWFDGVNLNKLFADDINSKIGDLEQLLLYVFENNKLVSLNNSDKIKKIFDKFRTLQDEKSEDNEYKEGEQLGGSIITLDDFKNYIKRKIREIIPKNVQ
jgi:hypothetical protein